MGVMCSFWASRLQSNGEHLEPTQGTVHGVVKGLCGKDKGVLVWRREAQGSRMELMNGITDSSGLTSVTVAGEWLGGLSVIAKWPCEVEVRGGEAGGADPEVPCSPPVPVTPGGFSPSRGLAPHLNFRGSR